MLEIFDQKSGESGRTRTVDPLIKSEMLYRLSYGLTKRSVFERMTGVTLLYRRIPSSVKANIANR